MGSIGQMMNKAMGNAEKGGEKVAKDVNKALDNEKKGEKLRLKCTLDNPQDCRKEWCAKRWSDGKIIFSCEHLQVVV